VRERSGDVPLLVDHYVRLFASISDRARVQRDRARAAGAVFRPGNIRELRNVTERIVTHAVARHQPEHLPKEVIAAVNAATRRPPPR
jgi:transcriptional regulator with GAF, ATPase, and Fis domain